MTCDNIISFSMLTVHPIHTECLKNPNNSVSVPPYLQQMGILSMMVYLLWYLPS